MNIETGKLKNKEEGAGKTKVKSRRPVFIYLFCLLLATITWLLLALSKEYRYEIRLPYSLVNLPKGKVPVGKIPNTIRVEVEASGFALLSYTIRGTKAALPLDVQAYGSSVQHIDAGRLVLPLEAILHDRFFKDHSELRFLSVYPKELVISFSDSYSKRVPVLWKGSLHFAVDCDSVGSTRITPDSVTVYGSVALLKKLDHLDTKTVQFSDVKESFKQTVEVSSGDLTVEPSQVEVAQVVERFTGQSEVLQVHVLHQPEGLKVRLLPKHVNVSYSMPLYAKKSKSRPILKAEVDMLNMHAVSGKVKVLITDVTGQAKKMKSDPVYIDYILMR